MKVCNRSRIPRLPSFLSFASIVTKRQKRFVLHQQFSFSVPSYHRPTGVVAWLPGRRRRRRHRPAGRLSLLRLTDGDASASLFSTAMLSLSLARLKCIFEQGNR